MRPMNVHEPIAVVGMGCRLPGGVSSPDAYWRLLCDGVDATCEVPNGRWPELDALCARGAIYTRRGGFLAEFDPFAFDASFFGISPREALAMDPQQRFLLEVAWDALEDAGLPPRSLAGGRTGVFVGICASDYAESKDARDVYSGTGNYFSVAAGRIAYVFDFRGPAMAVDTACSSSLVAVHLACQSLRLGECNVALAGGVNLMLSPSNTVYFCALKTMAPDGRCKTFDASADGYARGEGCVVLVLKRLADAVAAGDDVRGVIRGSAVNQDGRSNGLTAPNGLAQRDVVRDALANAGLEPADVAAVEAHGTGTPLGDPIEMEALAAALGEARRARLVVGSVKTNFGHLEGSAGIAGLLKMLLAVRHGQIPRHLHFDAPNPEIAWDELPVVVPSASMPWPPGRRIGGVSSFGLSGTNAHVIVEEPPEAPGKNDEAPDGDGLLLISAASSDALAVRANAFRQAVAEAGDGRGLADLCYTAGARRAHLPHRVAVVGGVHGASMLEGLDAFLAGQPLATVATGAHEGGGSRRIAFVFPGQGAQWPGMGLELLAEPAFRTVFLRCDEIVRREAGWSLVEELSRDSSSTRIDATEVTQPAMFALQAGVVALLASWGVTPDAIVGHSFGEIAAAYAAGAIGVEDGVRIALQRGRVMKASFGSGRMALVELSVAEVERTVPQLGTSVWISGINGPKSVVLAGDGAIIVDVVRGLEERGIFARVLWGEYPSHSPRMLPFGRDLVQSIAGIEVREPTVFLVSTVTGRAYAPGDFAPAYWGRNLCEPVQFEVAMRQLVATGADVFLEIGPHPQLTKSMRDGLPAQAVVLGSLRRDSGGRQALLSAVGALYAAGCDFRWEQLFPKGRLVSLPRYPWQRERYWQGRRPGQREPMVHPLLGRVASTDGHAFRWRNTLTAEGLLGDHLIHGEPVMAGAVYMEMALSVAREMFGGLETVAVEDLRLHAVFVPPRQLEAVAEREPSGDVLLRFASRSRDGEAPIEHASVRLVARPAHAREPQDIEAIRRRCPALVRQADWLAFLGRVGVQLDRGFVCIEQLWRGESEAIARVAISNDLDSEARGFCLYPALIEGAVEALAVACLYQRPELAIPVAIDSIRFHREPGFKAWAHATVRDDVDGSPGGDSFLFDENGDIALELRGVRLRRIDAAAASAERVTDWFYEEAWEPQPPLPPVSRSADPAPSKAKWLVFADRLGTAAGLRGALAERGDACLLVYAGDGYEEIEPDVYCIRPTRADDFARLLIDAFEGSVCAGVVHLWSLDVAPFERTTVESLDAATDIGCISALHLARALVATKHRPRLWLVTSGAVPLGAACVQAAQAPLAGFGKVLALEHPEFSCTSLDLDPRARGDVRPWLPELTQPGPRGGRIAYCDGVRYAPRLVQAKLGALAPDDVRLRPDATYLITGGTGGLGLACAQRLIDRGARHIALIARGKSRAPSGVLEGLRARANVEVFHADVAHRDELRAALAAIRTGMPPVRGLLHAAGTLADATIQHLTASRFRSVLPAKVAGAWHLHEATRELSLDFFVLFSSGASLLGSPGQANYAAANAFLDALAHARRSLGLPALSINWAAWAEVGMVASRAEDGTLSSWTGASLTTEQGLRALDVLLQARVAQCGVFPFDMGSRAATDSDVPSCLVQRLLADPLAGKEILAPFLLDGVARVLKIAPSKLTTDAPINHFGLDSLTAMELKNAIQAELGIALNTIALLRGRSIADLTVELFEQFLLNHIDELSEEDVAALTKQLE
ncbi:type I polyketide synthase [Pendulispora rubella]|uniref:Type I polyketide synthase n=1 Tax=Pendulispora rubella TaxID=2741070 RepID=A0ABZ2LEZ9_9BACT